MNTNDYQNGDEKAVLVSHSPLGSLVACSPALVVTDFKSGETYQLSLVGEAVSLPSCKGRG